MPKTINHKLALEMAMQDVMDNMEELSLSFAFRAGPECFEILGIEAVDAYARSNAKAKTRTSKPVYRDIYGQKAKITRLRVA